MDKKKCNSGFYQEGNSKVGLVNETDKRILTNKKYHQHKYWKQIIIVTFIVDYVCYSGEIFQFVIILVSEANFPLQFFQCIGACRRRKGNYSLEYFVFPFLVKLVSYASEYLRICASDVFFLLTMLFPFCSFF